MPAPWFARRRNSPNRTRSGYKNTSNPESGHWSCRLFSQQPIYLDFEIAKLGDSLGWLSEQLGYKDPLVHKVLAGKSPYQRATELSHGHET